MTSSSKAQHHAQLSDVAERLRSDGYEVLIEPGQSEMPFDLGGYRPDVLARRGQEGILVEVKSRADRLSVDRLQSVVEEVRRHPGWRFILVTGQDVADSWPVDEGDQITWSEIIEGFDHARNLRAQGDLEASYIVMWIAFERLLRLQARRVGLPIERLQPSTLIRQLYSQGELTMPQFDIALGCQETRNRVVHGLRSPDLPNAADRLDILIRELLQAWEAPGSAA